MLALNAFQIKVIAFALMIIDHVGRLFFPGSWGFVALGRLSFPLFAWLAAQGEQHTSNLPLYLLRLVGWGAIAQIVYMPVYYLIFNQISGLNILFSLALGVATVRLAKLVKVPIFDLVVVLLGAALGEVLRVEGGAFSVLTLYVLSLFNPTSWRWWLVIGLMMLAIAYLFAWPLELFGLLSLGIIALHNGEPGNRTKWFYPLYPLHFAVLLALYWWLDPSLTPVPQ